LGTVGTTALARWLATLDPERLAEIVTRRPEAAAAPAPRNLVELADRLSSRTSVADAFRPLPEPGVQVIEALQALLEGTPEGTDAARRDDLAELLGRTPGDPEIEATLGMLAQRALVWPDGDRLRMVDPLRRAFAHPLRLGRTLAVLLAPKVASDLKRVADRLRRPALRLKREIVDDLVGWLADPVNIASIVARAPEATRALLAEAATNGPLISAEGAGYGYAGVFPPEVGWALERGLLVADGWQLAEMPREVALALRGSDWRAPFTPVPPLPTRVPVDPSAVGTEAAAAAGSALDEVTAVLESCSSAPLALRKSGGVGSREVRRLAKAVGVAEPAVRLWLELAQAAGLLAVAGGEALVTEGYDEWCAMAPGQRLAALLRGWWELASLPLLESDEPPRPAPLARDPLGRVAVELRRVVIVAAAELPAGTTVSTDTDLGPLVRWHAPLPTSMVTDVDQVVAALWQEAHLLGVAGLGAVSELGRALLDTGRDDVLAVVARSMLPPASTTAKFQADLTAVVTGSPSAELGALLDGCADRESRGAASTWRFSPASVRRALDAGLTGDALLTELRAVAAGSGLPQPLEYLVTDVARRHGTLRVRAIGCVIHSDDIGLLAEIAAARPLAPLRLHRLAPTVLASAKAPADTLAALRQAGYAPTGEDVTGAVVVERAPRRRAEEAAPVVRRVIADGGRFTGDPSKLAATLLATPLPEAPAVPATGRDADPHESIGYWAPQLSRFQVRLLAHALEHGSAVRIEYTNAQGTSSERVIEPLDLTGHLLEAWCHLRDDERVFALDRIDSVAPA
jgi:Helicase conserved C-terminal domain/WYL domain